MKSGDLLSHYQLTERIGAGGMGIVWKAFDTILERPVAIKVLPDELAADRVRLERFKREARMLAALNHPGIVTIYSVEGVNDIHFLTMEWIPGRTLEEVIQPEGVSLSTFLAIARPVVEALKAAEEQGITHSDLKPANVIFSNSGRIKVLDFGLARAVTGGSVSGQTTTAGTTADENSSLAGTLHYMAPEVLRGETADHRSDIFALGVLFHELAVGRRPFEGGSATEIMASILRDVPPSILERRPDWPVWIDRIIGRCLVKDPEGRCQSAEELQRELVQATGEGNPYEGGPRSIAVLPFLDMSQEQDQGFFCDGIAEEITNALSRIADLRVASRASAFRFRSRTEDLKVIGGRLGVRTLLTGSLRKSGSRVRISTELINVANGYQLWSTSFDREATDIFAIQDEIAESVVEALEVSLSPYERRAMRSVATRDARAYEYFLRGRPLLHRHSRLGIESARQMFQKAIEIDPNYALAHAGIADCCSFTYLYIDRSPAQRDCALAAGRRALELDPGLAQVHVSHGLALLLFDRTDEAIVALERALELEPRSYDAHFFYARECIMRGDFEKAAWLLERAGEIRPEDCQAPGLLGQVYANLGRNREAVVARRRCVENADEQLAIVPDDTRALYLSANAQIQLGDSEAGLKRARKAAAMDPDDCMLLYNVGCILTVAGKTDEALNHLERSVQAGNIQTRYFERDTDLDSLRTSPRFKKMMVELKRRDEERKSLAPDIDA